MNRPLLAAFLCLACGILLASVIKIPITFVLILAALAIIFSILTRHRNKPIFIISVLISIIFIGAASLYNSILIPSNHIANKIARTQDNIYIKGSVVSDPVFYETFWEQRRATFTLKADYYKQDNAWIKSYGLCKVITYKSERNYSYGDNLVLFGRLKPLKPPANPGGFDYSNYLKRQKIYTMLEIDSDKDLVLSQDKSKVSLLSLLKAKIFALRRKTDEYIHKYLPKKEADLISAIMLGLRSELPDESKELFVQTGTAHILAISGLHLAIIAYIFFFVLGLLRIRYNLRAFLVIVIICFYAILCGGRPSVVRAAIMITTFLIARILNRETDVYNTLSLAGILILLSNPMQLFSTGFILSFICVFSIVYLTPKIEGVFSKKEFSKKNLYLIRPLSISLAAYIGVAPIIAYIFNIVSFVTIIANLLIVPLAGLLICVGLTFIFFGLLSASLASIFGATTWLVAFLLQRLIFYLSKIPYAYFYIPDLPVWSMVGYYGLIILVTNRTRFKLSKGKVSIIILLCINFYIWFPLFGKDSGQLKITFLDVGHGAAIFIQFPKGGTMLVDAGAKSPDRDKGKEIVMPYIWYEGKNRVDCMVITHGHVDHFGGASAVINRANVRSFLYNGIEEGEKGYTQLMNLVKSLQMKTLTIKEGDEIKGFEDVQVLVLNPSKEFVISRSVSKNDASVVLKLTYKNISFLLCADILEEGIKNILPYAKLLKSNVLYVPHHGSDRGRYITGLFYSLVNPDIAVISSARNYRYPLPAESTLELLEENGSLVYITDKDGAITITTDGQDYNTTTTYSRKNF